MQVAQMVQREPEKRLTAEEYLKQQRGKAFPEIFYTFLQPYMAQFAKETFQSADERVLVIRKNLENILNNLCSGGQTGKTEKQEKASQELSLSKEQGLVVLVSVITSCLQTLQFLWLQAGSAGADFSSGRPAECGDNAEQDYTLLTSLLQWLYATRQGWGRPHTD